MSPLLAFFFGAGLAGQVHYPPVTAPVVAPPQGPTAEYGAYIVSYNDCRSCHGADLRGVGPVPGIAGRSPSYIARQLFDMQAGTRHGEWSDLMKPVVAKLTEDDLVNLSAYVSSIQP